MPYHFNFDLTRVSRFLFREIAVSARNVRAHKRLGETARNLMEKFRIREITGLDVSDALALLEDFIDIQMRNLADREKFLKATKKALLLPHCSRKYMDHRCKARFDSDTPSYTCSRCSPDCLINQATQVGMNRNYDVYVLPGGSCINRILKQGGYEAVVGVACGEEITLAYTAVEKVGLPIQAVPLTKNGCSHTKFSLQTLKKVL